MIDLNLHGVQDPVVRDNFRKIQDFLNNLPVADNFQACEVFVTGNVSGATMKHKLGGVPKDVIISQLIAPSAAKLKFTFSAFTKDAVAFDVTGLSSGETLYARFLVGTFPNLVTVGEAVHVDTEVQEIRGKF